jgi:inorganic triphosphatase YgiF
VSSDPSDPTFPATEVGAEAGAPSEAPAALLAERPLRLRVAREALPRLRRHPLLHALAHGRPSRRALRLTYFDTPDLDLGRVALALRLRRVGRHHVQTLERLGPARPTVATLESLVPGAAPDPERLPDPAERERVLEQIGGRPLVPAFEVELVRFHRTLREDANELAVDLEVGEIRSRAGSETVCELELASRSGDPGQPHQLALELLDSVALRPSTLGLAERGYAQLSGQPPAARRAERGLLPSESTLEQLLIAVVAGCLDHVASNEPAALAGIDPEGVHQMRVGLRRLRSALAFFGPVIPDTQRSQLRAELRWLAGELGPARDIDVFRGELLPPLLALRPHDAALARLGEAADAVRAERYARVREALAGTRYPRLVLGLGRWLARRAWRQQPTNERSAALFQPARPWAAALLERRHRKARKLGRRLADASPAERHRLRIRLKKLRYAAEFSRGLFSLKRADRYARRLADLQDALGRLNDAAIGERLLAELLARLGDEETVRAAGYAGGWIAHAAHREAQDLTSHWERFEQVGRFWPRD